MFVSNPSLYRISSTQPERDHMVEMGLIQPRLRLRPINVITARGLFRQFGHLAIKRGRPVHDDYYCTGLTPPTAAEEACAIAEWEERHRIANGETNDASGHHTGYGGGSADRSHGGNMGSGNNANAGPGGAGGFARTLLVGGKPDQITITGIQDTSAAIVALPVSRKAFDPIRWIVHSSGDTAQFNRQINHQRRTAMAAFFDVHTGLTLPPSDTQPTCCIIEKISDDVKGNNIKEEQISDGERWQCKVEEQVQFVDNQLKNTDLTLDVYPVAVEIGQYQSGIPV
jgi:hypothetical protein